MNDWTPLPGTIVPSDSAVAIINSFRSKYRLHTEGHPPNIPTWVTFPDEGIRASEAIFHHPEVIKEQQLYFYWENANEVYLATPQQVENYFLQRNPWETNWDLYVLKTDLSWCIAVTHELADGPAVIVVGEISKFT